MPDPAPFSPLSDVDGRITHVFLALPASDRVVSARLLDCFRGIFEALGPGVRCTVLHHPGGESALEQLAAEVGVTELDLCVWKDGTTWKLEAGGARLEGKTLVIGRPPWPDFTHWVQDGFVVDGAAEAACLWATPSLERAQGGLDERVPRRLAEHLGWGCSLLPCPVEAGNLLVDGRHVVVGGDVRAQSASESASRLAELLVASGERRLLWLPREGAQPIFHQDLYLTLAGDDEDGRPTAVVGSVRDARRVFGDEDARRAHGDESQDDDPDTLLDALADSLDGEGYRVVRLPLLPFLDPRDGERRWVTYNNALVEVFPARAPDRYGVRRRVTLPAYRTDGGEELETLDAAAEEVWGGLGFEVRWARGPFFWLARASGNLRCMTKVLRREFSG